MLSRRLLKSCYHYAAPNTVGVLTGEGSLQVDHHDRNHQDLSF
jgi:hypothetical protein